MCEIGGMLRVAREESGRSIRDWARELGIKSDYLRALEECRFEDLPEAVLAKGHLRRYAEALGLDPEPLLAQYPVRPTFTPEDVITPERRRGRPWLWIVVLAVLLALAGGAWLVLQSPAAPEPAAIELEAPPPPPPPPSDAELSVETVPPGATVWLDGFRLGEAPVSGRFSAGERTLRVEAEGYVTYEAPLTLEPGGTRHLKVTLAPLPAAETPAPAGPPKLVLRFSERAWVRVTTPEGAKLYEGIPKVGSELEFPLPVVVRTGNAAGVRAVLGGEDLGPMGGEGLVVERRFDAPAP
ncbi:RodZ domain-containing protein [Oceanithermus desulfurans]